MVVAGLVDRPLEAQPQVGSHPVVVATLEEAPTQPAPLVVAHHHKSQRHHLPHHHQRHYSSPLVCTSQPTLHKLFWDLSSSLTC